MISPSLALLAVGIALACDGDSQASQSGRSEPVPARHVDYRIVEQWSIPNGGYGKVIVIADSLTTDSGLRALGEQLKYDTRDDRNAFVTVFSDVRAAGMRQKAMDDALSKSEARFYDAHLVADYTRNANTGFHRLSLLPKGLNGPQSEINY
jgi:hypothetical protein